jgi:hypothetical protein
MGCFLLTLLAATAAYAQQDVSRLRIANFMENPPSEKLHFYLDDEQTPFASALSFAEVSVAIGLNPGNHSVSAVPTGSPKDATIFTEEFTVSADSTYMLVSVRTPGDTLRGLLVSRLLSPPIAAGKFLAGLVHASPRLGTIRWMGRNAGGQLQLDGKFWFGPTINGEWYMRPVGEGPLISTLLRQDTIVGNTFIDQYLGGRIVWLVLTGTTADSSLSIYTLIDDDTLEQRPVHKQRRSGEGDGKIREVNLVPDIHLSEGAFVEFDLWRTNSYRPPFRHTSPFIGDMLGLTRIQSIFLKDGPIYFVLKDTVTINADTIYTYYLVGTGLDTMANSVVLRTPLNAVPATDKSWLRVLHAAPDLGPVDLTVTYGDGSKQQFTNLRFRESTDYAEITPYALAVQVYAAGSSTLLFERSGWLPADSVWTLILSGLKTRNSLGINLLNDLNPNWQAPMVLMGGGAAVRSGAETQAVTGVVIAPNPAGEMIGVQYMLANPADVNIALYDMMGRVVRQQMVTGSGRQNATLSTDDLPNGTYQIALTDNDGTTLSRAMVLVLR